MEGVKKCGGDQALVILDRFFNAWVYLHADRDGGLLLPPPHI